jgi:DNA polymerase IV
MVLHVDMDAFYAAVEQRDRPELLGRPVVVGGTGRRGVVSTASYEARRFGVKSALPMAIARRLCPQAVFIAGRMAHYKQVSRQVMEILARFSPTVEPLSLDEAFLDGTGTEELFGPPIDVAWKIKKAIRDELQLSCAVGVATNKTIAKIASDLKKPGGIVVVSPGEEQGFLGPLPVERLWGVGEKAAEKLRAVGLNTIDDVARQPEEVLRARLGALGPHILQIARGEDARPVDAHRERKSLGAERTLETDIRGTDAVRRVLLALADEVAAGLRQRGLRAGGVRVKVKTADFHQITREATLATPANDAASLLLAVDALLPRVDLDRPLRLVGIVATHLTDEEAPRQPDLFAAPTTDKAERLGAALDRIADKHGQGAVRRGTDDVS